MASGSVSPAPSGGPIARPARGAAGFSLLELLAVLALCGLIAALLIGGSGNLIGRVTQDDVQHTALAALAGARHSAVLQGRTLELRYDEEARVLEWGAGRAALEREGAVRLLPPTRTAAQLLGGQLAEEPLARVRFYADGTCDPFRLEIVRERTSLILAIDPWTCTVLASAAGAGPR